MYLDFRLLVIVKGVPRKSPGGAEGDDVLVPGL